MARHPQPRRITLGGHEAVALTVREYERLTASRRQIGGQSARVRVLAQQVKRTEQLLNELENLVSDPADRRETDRHEPAGRPSPECRAAPGAGGAPDAECLRCAIADLIRRHRTPAT
ncbi:hypothetical protein AB0D59_12115 [Streptomyces sp. NPDC048417]|uniref:hypothetical protein n=1 Tax=Streptomyces sp. NPDC048417 TaxID=3155387 RepID=UPI003433091D